MHLLSVVMPLVACALSGASLGCSVGISPAPPLVSVAPSGTLTVRWTIANGEDPSLCSAYGASMLELVVYDEGGGEVARTNGTCEDFSVSIALPDGTYSADATLTDAAGNSRTVTKQLSAINVVTGTDIAIDVEFPPSSFL